MSKWFIAVQKNSGENCLSSPFDYACLNAPVGHYYADPMILKYEGVNYIFYEDFDYKKGVLGCVSIDENMKFSSPRNVSIGESVHCSFPFFFQDEGKLYMIPETNQNWSVSLYEPVEFPQTWKKSRQLISGDRYSDSILFKYQGFYWLFTSLWMDQMRIFYAKDLESEFKPHPMNDRSLSGRNAGGVFWYQGKMIRPVMDCSDGHYGKAVIFKEIVALTTDSFEEQELGRIDPNWAPYIFGTHTFSINEDFIVYDAVRSVKVSEDQKFSSDIK